MSKTVWKFPIEVGDCVRIEMPSGAQVVSVDLQFGQLCVWAIVDPEAPLVQRTFWWRGTGHRLPDQPSRFVGTVLTAGGSLVFHLFEPQEGCL